VISLNISRANVSYIVVSSRITDISELN